MTRTAERPLRSWQREALARLARWESGPFLLSAAPGAGKTRPALELAKELLRRRQADRALVLCPTAPLTRQWAAAAAELGLQLQPDAPSPRPPHDFDGVCVTYARVASDARAWSGVSASTLVIADEAHHLGEELSWGACFADAFSRAKRWLLLSGTPFRSDATPIPGVSYDADGLAEPDYSYDYDAAVRDGVCRPVAFVTFDGSLSWRSGEDVVESSFETVLTAREASRRYRTALSTKLPEGLPRILSEANERLMGLREREHREAGGLVVAADTSHARAIAKLLRETTGRAPAVVLHTDGGAAATLAAFRSSREPWIVAVNMVSEGVDIPRLRVGVYASAAKTPLIFRQIVGRFVRTLPGRAVEPSWLYLPADPVLRRHASEIQSELRTALRPRGEGEEELLEERREGRESERSETADFVPLSAEFAPQLTLFGPRAPAMATATQETSAEGAFAAVSGGRAREAAVEAKGDAGEEGAGEDARGQRGGRLAAYERREHLRRQRSRLVGELQRRGGMSHREVNWWLNRAVGLTRVEQATIAQLERS
ncbi:MAG: DEAD/DEAH box helicase, partial [Solirubrobacteraceae bacterium]